MGANPNAGIFHLIGDLLTKSQFIDMSVKIIKVVYSPKVSHVFIDKIAVVFDTPYSISHFKKYADKDPSATFASTVYHVAFRFPGAEAFQPDTSNQTSITFMAGPKGSNKSKHQCRLEFNPSKVSPATVLMMLHDELQVSYEDSVKSGTVTRLDLAVDVFDVSIDQLLFRAKKYSVTENEYSRGRTLYIGGRFSKTKFRIYDKAAEIKAKNKKTTNPTLHEPLPEKVVTRIELSTKPNLALTALGGMESPFGALQVLYVGTLKKSLANDLGQVFLLTARHLGVYPAWMKLSQSAKKKIGPLLQAASVDWWQPQTIWLGYPKTLEPVLHPFGP